MRKIFNSIIFILIFDTVVCIICGIGIYNTFLKLNLPLKLQFADSNLIVKKISVPDLKSFVGDTLYAVDGQRFNSREQIEVYLDGIHPDHMLRIDFKVNGNVHETFAKPVKFYSEFYLVINSIAVLIFILIGAFVFIKNPLSQPNRLFHWVIVLTAVIMATTWGNYSISPLGLGYFLRLIFSVAYTLAPVVFLHFTLNFPRRKLFNSQKILLPLYALSLIVGTISYLFFLKAAGSKEVEDIFNYLLTFDLCRLLTVVCIISGVLVFFHSYKTAKVESEKKKIRWILYGLFTGPLAFAVLWVIPQAVSSNALIPEELLVILMFSIPVTFAISILKYHAFDIDLIIKRSVIYFLVIGMLLIIYISMVYFLSDIIKTGSKLDVGTFSVIIIALLFQPFKTRIQKFVDRKFFRVQYDFREALKKFFNEIKNAESTEKLTARIVQETDNLLPVTKIGFFLFNKKKSRIFLTANNNFDILEGRSIFLDEANLKTALNLPVAVPGKVENTVPFEIADNRVFQRWGIALVLPIKSSERYILGFLVLGEKKSGQKFTVEDVDLLSEVTLQAGLAIERIAVHEELINQQVEKEKFKELNRTKSYFISTVSHELKTPLTSIRMFAELLQLKKSTDDSDSQEYLEIISGECDRLGRLIENVLDLSKIERGVKEYNFSEINVNALLKKAVDIMSYQFKTEKCEVEMTLCPGECSIYADKDSVMSAVLNILSNGIKYSVPPKKIRISVEANEKFLGICFENNGPAISENEIRFVTKPYYRSGEVINKHIPGSGIGLALVNQIMTAHKGCLEINSRPVNGCKFILKFPTEKNDETDFYNRR